MKILFVSENFPPESNAPANRTYEHACYWVKWGHEVTIITSAPNFPEGKLFEGYSNDWYLVEWMDGIKVIRVKTYISANKGILRRAIDYISFFIMASLTGICQPRPDIVVGTSPQILEVAAAWIIAVFKRRPFVFELRDIWPESIVAVGAMKHGFIIRILEFYERFLYRHAQLIVCVTEAFADYLRNLGTKENKLVVVRNGVNIEQFADREDPSTLKKELGFEGKTIISYIGTQGMAHSLDTLIDTAEKLKYNKNIVFMLVGSGAETAKLKALCKQKALENLHFIPRQIKSEITRYWKISDLTIISLRNTKLFATVIPSKIFEAMAAGTPMICSIPKGEASEIIVKYDAGIKIEPESSNEMKNAILSLVESPERRREISNNAKAAADQFSRKAAARKMLHALQNL
ncbi:MAG: glycosyltransferase family 4 protein [Pseudomonadales bacterium]|nr:glycosyltransferase family 4 protein [Pseudomonadales bacterium]